MTVRKSAPFPLSVPLAGGLDDKIFKALVPPGKMLQIDGAQIDKLGAVGLVPQPTLVSTESGTTCTGLLSDGQLINRTLDTEEYDPFKIEEIPVIPPDGSDRPCLVTGGDVARYGSSAFVVVCSLASGTGHDFPFLVKQDLSTRSGAIFSTPIVADATCIPRVVVAGDYLYVFYAAGGFSMYRSWDLTTETELVGSPFTIAAASATLGVSACADANATRAAQGYCWLAWLNAANNPQVTEIYRDTNTLKYSDATIVAVSSPGIAPSLSVSTRYSLAVSSAATLKGYVWDTSAGLVRSASLVGVGNWATPVGVELSGSFYWFVRRIFAGTPHDVATGCYWISTTANGAIARTMWCVSPSSSPVVRDGRIYMWVRYCKPRYAAVPLHGSEQPTEFLVRINVSATTNKAFAFAVASAVKREAMGSTTWTAHNAIENPSSMFLYNGAYYHAAVSEPQTLVTTQAYGACVLVKSSFAQQPRIARIGNKIVMTGGLAFESCGSMIQESNFIVYPEIISHAPGGGGTLTPGATYYIKAVYCHVDSNGERHLSAPSLTATQALGGGQTSIAVSVSQYPLGRRDFSIQLYLSTDGISFYLSAEYFYFRTGPTDTYYPVSALAFSATAPLLYTSGGVLDNGGAPCLTDVVAHGDRFFGVTPDGVLCYSKPVVDGIGVEWSPELLTHQLIDDGGSHWQLASMDGQLIAIGVNSIQAVRGDGALDTGAGSTLSLPEKIIVDGGIIDKTYALTTSEGVWFQSRSGLKKLTRGLEIDGETGRPIEDLISGKLLRSASSSRSEYLFVFCDAALADGGSSYAYAWDTESRAWIGRSASFGGLLGSTPGIGVDSAGNVFVASSYSAGKSMQALYWASPSYAYSGLALRTPWLKVGTTAEDQRVRHVVLNGEWLSDMTLTFRVRYDDDDTVSETYTYTYDQVVHARAVGSPFVFRQHLGRRCSSICLAVTIAAKAGTPRPWGACCRLYGLTVELAKRPGLLRASTTHER